MRYCPCPVPALQCSVMPSGSVTLSPSGLQRMEVPSLMSRSLPSKLTGTVGENTNGCFTVCLPTVVVRGLVYGRVCDSPEKPMTVVVLSDNVPGLEVFMVEHVAPVSTRNGRSCRSTRTRSIGSAATVLFRSSCGVCQSWLTQPSHGSLPLATAICLAGPPRPDPVGPWYPLPLGGPCGGCGPPDCHPCLRGHDLHQ